MHQDNGSDRVPKGEAPSATPTERGGAAVLHLEVTGCPELGRVPFMPHAHSVINFTLAVLAHYRKKKKACEVPAPHLWPHIFLNFYNDKAYHIPRETKMPIMQTGWARGG